MERRVLLQEKLEALLGSRNVYFQPPESVRMKYPAIVYAPDSIEGVYANDGAYLIRKRYSVTLIDPDPDSRFVDLIFGLAYCRFNRFYSGENLNHWNFSLYF